MPLKRRATCAVRREEPRMSNKDEKVIERIFDDAIERAWEEAKLRDLVTLFYMWKEGTLKQFDSFDLFLETFYQHDEVVRGMDERQYFSFEKDVVEIICNSPDGKLLSPCKNLDDPCT
jgi:hypothetical protein